MSIAIVTYPRTGSHYLQLLLSSSFGEIIEKFHFYQKETMGSLSRYDCLISTVRNPIDSMSSMLTMESFFFENKEDLYVHINKVMNRYIEVYLEFHENAKEKVDILFDYEDIDKKRNELVSYVSNKTNKKIINNDYSHVVVNNIKNKYLASSKMSEQYEEIKKIVTEKNLSSCFDVYNICKSMTAKI
jgi:hypothetical protein